MCKQAPASTLGTGKPTTVNKITGMLAGTPGRRGAERRRTMVPNPYDREQFAQTHRQDLLREAEHERQLAQLSQPNSRIPFFAPPMLSLRTLSIKLQKGHKLRAAWGRRVWMRL